MAVPGTSARTRKIREQLQKNNSGNAKNIASVKESTSTTTHVRDEATVQNNATISANTKAMTNNSSTTTTSYNTNNSNGAVGVGQTCGLWPGQGPVLPDLLDVLYQLRHVFDEIELYVYQNLCKGSFDRYLHSPEYKSLLEFTLLQKELKVRACATVEALCARTHSRAHFPAHVCLIYVHTCL